MRRLVWLLAAFAFAASVQPVDAQQADQERFGVSAWLGGVTDVAGASWTVSPSLGLRAEARIFGPVWVGAEVDTWFVDESFNCPGSGDPYSLALYPACDSGSFKLRPVLSGHSRIDLGGETLRPYLAASLGRTNNTALWSAGAGLRWARSGGVDLSAETRYRSSDRFSSLGYQHWEFVVGAHLR